MPVPLSLLYKTMKYNGKRQNSADRVDHFPILPLVLVIHSNYRYYRYYYLYYIYLITYYSVSIEYQYSTDTVPIDFAVFYYGMI